MSVSTRIYTRESVASLAEDIRKKCSLHVIEVTQFSYTKF